MRKMALTLLAGLMLCCFAACGSSDAKNVETTEPTQIATTPVQVKVEETDPAAVLERIASDFSDTIENIVQKQEEMFAQVGTTYADYEKNKGMLDEWIELTLAEVDDLFARTREYSVAYFKLVAEDPAHRYYEFCDEALDNYYDTVYDDAMDDYYDDLYDDAMDDLYDQYYDGIVGDAYKKEKLEYSQWSKATEECYKTWSDTRSAVYEKWTDERSYLYGLWSAMNSAFCWDDNFDVEQVVKDYEEEYTKKRETEKVQTEQSEITEKEVSGEIMEQAETKSDETTETDQDNMSSDFKEMMDSYEAFFDEYCDLVSQYTNNPTDMTLLGKYMEFADKATEMNEAFEAWGEKDLTAEEEAYYLEVSARVIQKLLSVAE